MEEFEKRHLQLVKHITIPGMLPAVFFKININVFEVQLYRWLFQV